MSITTIYLIRHSIRLKISEIESYRTNQNPTIRNEKIILSSEGEKRAEILSNETELQNIDKIYVSNSVRTIQTAKYMMEKQNLKANIDDRLDERRVGIPNDNEVTDWWLRQYLDENYKTEGGESQKYVRGRFEEAFNEIVSENRGKRVAVFSHGYAITFFIMKWCKFKYLKNEDCLSFTFKDDEFFRDKVNAPEVFKLEVDDNNELLSIKLIRFEDLPYTDKSIKT